MNIKFVIVGVAVLSVLAPSTALAARLAPSSNTPTQSVEEGKNFCTSISANAPKFTARMTAAADKVKAKQNEIKTTVDNRQNKRAEELAQARATADATRRVMYEKLEAKAATPTQVAAVSSFKDAMEAAVATRRLAVDAAIQTYWNTVHTIIATRQTTVTNAAGSYATAVSSAVSAAITECSAGTASPTVRQHFMSSIKAATTVFASQRKTVDNAESPMKVAAETRNKAIKAAFTVFETAAAKAESDLKSAFGEIKK